MVMKILFYFILIVSSLASYAHEIYDSSGQLCLDVSGGAISNGSDILMYPCNGGSNQNFIYDKQQLKLVSDTSYCVDVNLGYGGNEGNLILWRCHESENENQKFAIKNNAIKPLIGVNQCLSYDGQGYIESRNCSSSNDQIFSIPEYCLYKNVNYDGERYCASGNKALIERNDDLSSVSLINSNVVLYEHRSYEGQTKKLQSNTPYVGNEFNDIASSLISNRANIKTFLMTSDPQLTCGSNCGLSYAESKQNVSDQYKMFSTEFQYASAVIINGDLTEYGHSKEWDDFEFALLNLKLPYYYGLGNHDIYNNLNDCKENNCTIRSFLKLYHHVNNKSNIVSFDANYSHGYEFPEVVEKLKGSLSYSMDFGEILIIQLNDYRESLNPIIIDQYSSGSLGNGAQRYKINREQDKEYKWLHDQLYNARKDNKIIIVNQHDNHANAGKLFKLLDDFDVKLRFAGHIHDSLGEVENKFFRSGSTAKGTYLKLDIDIDNKIARVYKPVEANSSRLIPVKNINLQVKPITPEKPQPQPKLIRVKNGGGYDSFVWVRYQTPTGNYETKSSNKLSLGNVYETSIPSDSVNISIRSANNTGLLWEPQRNIFNIHNISSDTCIETWGTTLHSRWGYTKCN
jgi:hypothetical protein